LKQAVADFSIRHGVLKRVGKLNEGDFIGAHSSCGAIFLADRKSLFVQEFQFSSDRLEIECDRTDPGRLTGGFHHEQPWKK
jgi:hypothetical protein